MTSASPTDTTSAPSPAISRRWTVAVIAIVVLPLVVGVVQALVDAQPNPGGDQAIIELRVRDVGTDTPVLGSYSRFGANHPGPLWFYALVAPYRILGSDFAALQVGTLLAGIAAVALVLLAVGRSGDRVVFLATAAIIAVFIEALGPAWVTDPWEPKGLTLLVAALALVAFAAVDGSTMALPVAAVIASILGQAQATLLPYAITLGVVAAAAVLIRGTRSATEPAARRSAFRAVAGAGVLTLALWSPPLLQQVRGEPGNISAFLDTMGDSPEPTLGLTDAWRAVALELSTGATWIGGELPLLPFQTIVDLGDVPLVPIGLVALVGATGLAIRQRDRLTLGLALVTAAGLAAGVASLSRLLGPLFVWIPSWTKVLGLLTALTIVASVLRSLPERMRPAVDRVGPPALGALLVGVTLVSLAAVVDDRPPTRLNEGIRSLAAATAPELADDVLVRSEAQADLAFGGDGFGLAALVLELERAGVDVLVDRELANRYGDDRARPERATSELRLVNATASIPAGFRIVGELDPLTAEERQERDDILAQVPALGDPDQLAEVARLVDDPVAGPLIARFAELPDLPALRLISRALEPSPAG